MENETLKKICNFGDSCIDYVDSGKFFRHPVKILYYLLSIVTLILPIATLINLIDIWDWISAEYIIMHFIYIFIGLFIAICSFYLWVKRAKALNFDITDNSRFIAIPLLANILQTIGEWAFITIGIGGFLIALISMFFEINNIIGIGAVIAMPISGYLTCLFMRYLAETIKAIANIANNTDTISKNLNK